MDTNDKKIIIQSVEDDRLLLNVNGEVQEIRNQLVELKKLLKEKKVQNIQYAEKIYNIENIDEANFAAVKSNNVFNGILSQELINIIKEKPVVKSFLGGIAAENLDNWPSMRIHLKQAQRLLENGFVWVVSWELRRLFSIGNDKRKPIEAKVDEYINHCFRTHRISLQLMNYIFLSELWDEKKKNPNLNTDYQPIKDFFASNRLLKLSELRLLFRTLIEIFKNNDLELPIKKEELGDFEIYLDIESDFNKACIALENLEIINQSTETYDLAHCHSAEIALAEVLTTFHLFSTYQIVTMRKVEYEEVRNNSPRYIKDFNVLEKRQEKTLQRVLKYDDKPSLTFAVLFRNRQNSINLFPFLLDFNALTREHDFQIFSYECRYKKSGLQYFSINSEKEETVYYRDIDPHKNILDNQKAERRKNIRLDLVIRQFQEVMNTILDKNEQFIPIDEVEKVDIYDDI